MKRAISSILLVCLLFTQTGHTDEYQRAISSPNAFFREIAKVMLQTQITWKDPAGDQNQLSTNSEKFLMVINAIEKQRKLNNKFGNLVGDIIGQDSVLNGHELHLLGKILGATHALSARALEYSSLYNLESGGSVHRVYRPGNNNLTKRNLIWLSTHVNLFGIYRDGYSQFYKDGKIRRIVKNIVKADSKKDHKLRELGTMIAHTTSKKNRKSLRFHLIDFKKNRRAIREAAAGDPQMLALFKSIENHPITADLRSKRKLKFKSHSFIDGIVTFLDKTMNIVSAFFGNSVGAVRWRKGYLYDHKPTHERLENNLRPLDIVFEKTPFALTDTFIPGNFGHAAIYIGTEKQLKEIGMWNHPDVIPHHENLKKGHVIVEALRPGVRSASLEEWMNIDEILVLRHPTIFNAESEEIHRMYSRIMRQIGKKYDFNFDVTTTDKVVCSELVYHAFGKINWPTKYIMGRATISPDDVAQVVLYKNTPIKFDSYIFSPSKGVIQDLDIQELAKRMGFIVNKKRSTPDRPSFDRVLRKCRQVRRTGLRQGSHRYRHRLISVCKTEYKELDYKDLERSYSIDKRHAEDGNH